MQSNLIKAKAKHRPNSTHWIVESQTEKSKNKLKKTGHIGFSDDQTQQILAETTE